MHIEGDSISQSSHYMQVSACVSTHLQGLGTGSSFSPLYLSVTCLLPLQSRQGQRSNPPCLLQACLEFKEKINEREAFISILESGQL